MNHTLAQQFATFAARLTPGDLPRDVVTRAKYCWLDSLGIALAAGRHDFARSAFDAALALGGRGNSPVIGHAERLPLRDAMLVNGTLIHGLDFDDTHVASVVHCSASAVPLAMNLGLEVRASGAEALAAWALAVEVDARIGEAARGGLQKRGFHPTGIVGAFGCAAAAAWMQRLGQEEFAHALGITLSFASGSMEFLSDGAWTKRLHPGWAAVCGLTAATFAGHGFAGPAQPLEGRFGLYNTLLGADAGIDTTRIAADFFADWRARGIAFKPYPACHFNHAFADCALALMREHGLAPEDVRSITARIHPDQAAVVCEPLAAKQRPANAYEAQFSVPWIVACACVRGRFTLAELEPEALADTELLALAARVDHVPDPASAYPRHYSGGLRLVTHDGRELEHHEPVNRGSHENPMSDQELLAKFHENAATALPPGAADRLADVVLCLETAPDLQELAATLAPTGLVPRQQAL